MKNLLTILLMTIAVVGYSQITPIDHTAPDADNLKETAIKINANDAYLDTMGVQRLDSLIEVGVGSDVTASNGLMKVGDDIRIGAPLTETITAIETNGNSFYIGANSIGEPDGGGYFYTDASSGVIGAVNSNNSNYALFVSYSDVVPQLQIDSDAPLFSGLTEASDYSANYTDLSHINRGFANSNYWPLSGTTQFASNSIILTDNNNTNITLGQSTDNIGTFRVYGGGAIQHSSGGSLTINNEGSALISSNSGDRLLISSDANDPEQLNHGSGLFIKGNGVTDSVALFSTEGFIAIRSRFTLYGGVSTWRAADNIDIITPQLEWNGTPISKVLHGSASLNFGSITTSMAAELTISVTGAEDGDPVAVGVPVSCMTGTLIYQGYVSAANTVTIKVFNIAGPTIDPPSATFKVTVHKQ